jgi:hypothetical protein
MRHFPGQCMRLSRGTLFPRALSATIFIAGAAVATAPSQAADISVAPCAAPSPAQPWHGSGAPEVRASAAGGTAWALLFHSLPFHPSDQLKIVWRVTGEGDAHFSAQAPDGRQIQVIWGPERHSGSNWSRPGDEWGTGWTLAEPGCWRLTTVRHTSAASIWVDVRPDGEETVPSAGVPPSLMIEDFGVGRHDGATQVVHAGRVVHFRLSVRMSGQGSQTPLIGIVLRRSSKVSRTFVLDSPVPGASPTTFAPRWHVKARPGITLTATAYAAMGATMVRASIRLLVSK